MKIIHGGGIRVRGPNAFEQGSLDVKIADFYEGLPSTAADTVLHNKSMHNVTLSNAIQGFTATVPQGYSLENLSPTDADMIGGAFRPNYITAGQRDVKFLVSDNRLNRKVLSHQVNREAVDAVFSTIKNYISNVVNGNEKNLALHVQNAVLSMVAGKTSAYDYWRIHNPDNLNGVNTQCMFTTTNADVNNFSITRNPNLFANGFVDLSGICVYREGNGTNKPNGYPLTLIHPRIAMTCNHTAAYIGQKFIYLDRAGNYQTRHVVATQRLYPDRGDFLHLFDSDFDVSPYLGSPRITIMKMMPANYETYLPDQNMKQDFPVLMMGNAGAQAQCLNMSPAPVSYLGILNSVMGRWQMIHGWNQWIDGTLNRQTYEEAMANPYHPPIATNHSLSSLYTWGFTINSGDSGSPIFATIDPAGGTDYQPVLLSMATVMDGSGIWFPDVTAQIESVMNSLLPGAAPAYIDLSFFQAY